MMGKKSNGMEGKWSISRKQRRGGVMRDKSNNPDEYGNVVLTEGILLLFRTYSVQR